MVIARDVPSGAVPGHRLLQAGQRYLPFDGWPWTGELARFYGAMLDWKVEQSEGWAEIRAVRRSGCFRGISGWSWSSATRAASAPSSGSSKP